MNPFEIRLELLKLAYQIEHERVMGERSRLANDWHVSPEKQPFPTITPVSVEDVIRVAENLNVFVSKKD